MSWQTGNPTQPGEYLVTYKGLQRNYLTIGVWFDGEWRWGDDSPVVLAWQPLPEPYRTPAPPRQAPWLNLSDGFTPPGIEMMCVRHGRTLLAQDPGNSWDGWILVRNPEDNGWVSLRKASDWERSQFERHGTTNQEDRVHFVQQAHYGRYPAPTPTHRALSPTATENPSGQPEGDKREDDE